jgi:hypothetical protein
MVRLEAMEANAESGIIDLSRGQVPPLPGEMVDGNPCAACLIGHEKVIQFIRLSAASRMHNS